MEYNALHRAFCFMTSPLGRFVDWVTHVIAPPYVEIEPAPGETKVITLCPCCVFWRGVLVGVLLMLLLMGIVSCVF